MQQNITGNDMRTERKIISISMKRQLTIPQKYYNALGFDNEAECILQSEGLLIRPLQNSDSEFSEQILADLISQGFEGAELLAKFKEYSKAVRPAVRKMLEDADAFVQSDAGKIPRDQLFGSEA